MNYIAHLYLSGDDPDIRLGNYLADMVRGESRQRLSAGLKQGIACHLAIDSFTDHHPQTMISRKRIQPPYARYSGVLIDVFYDHFLARDWHLYARQPFSEFVSEVYSQFQNYPDPLPDIAHWVIKRMAQDNWLGGYTRIGGVEIALRRLSRRLRRPFDLSAGIKELESSYAGLESDFQMFFPDLIAHIQKNFSEVKLDLIS